MVVALASSLVALILLVGAEAEANPQACTDANSKPLELSKVVAQARNLKGLCVKVRGVTTGGILFKDRHQFDAWQRADPFARSPKRVLGLYASLNPKSDRPQQITVIGRVGFCSDVYEAIRKEQARRDAERPTDEIVEIIMASGFCHSWDGVFLEAASTSKAR